MVACATTQPTTKNSSAQKKELSQLSNLTTSSSDLHNDKPTLDICTDGWKAGWSKLFTDNQDSGRIVFGQFPTSGPFGDEIYRFSITLTNTTFGPVIEDLYDIRTERVDKTSKTLLRATHLNFSGSRLTNRIIVGFNGSLWDRVQDHPTQLDAPVVTPKTEINISAAHLFGNQLIERMSMVAADKLSNQYGIAYYQPDFTQPIKIDIYKTNLDTTEKHDSSDHQSWVVATRQNRHRPFIKIMVSHDGSVSKSVYPAVHQVALPSTGLLTPPTATTPKNLGLRSKTYLGYPQSSTLNRYKITLPDHNHQLDITYIGKPENQRLTVINDRHLELEVRAGSPDGRTLPTQKDLEATTYITTDHPMITNALKYLKSAGKKGNLPANRKLNVKHPIAMSANVKNRRAFWKNPDKSAKLIADYVFSLLPEKEHTHTMMDSVTALIHGRGDCTEHAVLYAALMRAAGIPTRLISGMYMEAGGKWVFHMWNEYWSTDHWRTVDVANGPLFDPGAHYVALSKGSSSFADHRQLVAFFLDLSYSAMSFDLVSASAGGELLHLATATIPHPTGMDVILQNALTLSNRGDAQKALALIDQKAQPDRTPITIEILRAQLTFDTGQIERAALLTDQLLKKTSSPQNVVLLNQLDFRIALARGQLHHAEKRLSTLISLLGADAPVTIIARAQFKKAAGDRLAATRLLEEAINHPNPTFSEQPDAHRLLVNVYISTLVANYHWQHIPLPKTAFPLMEQLLFQTYFCDPETLTTAALLYATQPPTYRTLAITRAARLFRPTDATLQTIEKKLVAACGPSPQ